MPFDLGYPSHDFKSPRPGYRGTSLQTLHTLFPEERSCLDHVFKVRFGSKPRCECSNAPTTYYPRQGKRYYQSVCGCAISPLAGTLFHATKLPVSLWFYAMLHVANSTQGISAQFFARHLGITYVAAHRMLRQIRLHLAAIDQPLRIGSEGERVAVRLLRIRGVRRYGRGLHRSATILAISDHKRVDCTVVQDPRRSKLLRILSDKSVPGVRPFTNCYDTYQALTSYGLRKRGIEYEPLFYWDNPRLVDTIHGFFVYVRLPLKFNFKRVDRRNLWLYLKDFEFRYNRRFRSHLILHEMLREFPVLDQTMTQQLEAWHSR